MMTITKETTVADIATAAPGTIRIFKDREIDFCCGGKRSLADACAEHHLDVDALIGELRAAGSSGAPGEDWSAASLAELTAHIRHHYHAALRRDLPWLGQMLIKVVNRHGTAHPETLELQEVFNALHVDMLHHMQKEDTSVFPAVVALEQGRHRPDPVDDWISALEDDHEETSHALARMRELTGGYETPPDACPTFRGLYHGLSELDRDLRVHVHLENHVLFPRAAAMVRQ
jgi:regulator of cell morphogenesis and NO signaling